MSSPGFYLPQTLANVLAAKMRSYSSPDGTVMYAFNSAGKDGPEMIKQLIAHHGSGLSSLHISDVHRTSLIYALIECANKELLDIGLNSMYYPQINWSNIIDVDHLTPKWSREALLSKIAQQDQSPSDTDEPDGYSCPFTSYLRRITTQYLQPTAEPDSGLLDMLSDIDQFRRNSNENSQPLASIILPSYVDVRSDVSGPNDPQASTQTVDTRLAELLLDMSTRGIGLDQSYQKMEFALSSKSTHQYQNVLHEVLTRAVDSHYWAPALDVLINFVPWEPVLSSSLTAPERRLLLSKPVVRRTLLTEVSNTSLVRPQSSKPKI